MRSLLSRLKSAAGALIVAESSEVVWAGKTLIMAKNPRLAFAKAHAELLRRPKRSGVLDPSAVIDERAEIGEGVDVGALAFIGPGVRVGRRSVIGPGCMLLGDIAIGEDFELVARVTVYQQTKIGNRVTVMLVRCWAAMDSVFVPDEAPRTLSQVSAGGKVGNRRRRRDRSEFDD